MNHVTEEKFRVEFENNFSSFESECSAESKWKKLQNTMQKAALKVFGKKVHKSHDWFQAKALELTPVLDAKRIAFKNYKSMPNEKNL